MKSARRRFCSVLDQPICRHVLRALEKLKGLPGGQISSVAVVVGHKGEMGQGLPFRQIGQYGPHLAAPEQLGTGTRSDSQNGGPVSTICSSFRGDVPLLRSGTLAELVSDHKTSRADCSFASTHASNPIRLPSRVVRAGDGISIVEEKDASEEQKAFLEVNSGIYIFRISSLLPHIYRLDNENSRENTTPTTIISMMIRSGMNVRATLAGDENEFRGINTPRQLADVVSLVRSEIVEGHLAFGVRMMDPSSVWIGPKVSIGGDVSVDPFVQIWGETSIKRGCRIGGFSILRDMDLEEDVQVVSHAVLSGSILQKSSKAGPFIVIRDGACLEEGAQGGKFVEIKKSVLGKGSKAPHLSYLGDAVIGEGTNIGAGTITCNYDGEKKNPTVIGNRCFVGSDTMFVAPVTLGDDASTGAGSVITQNVPEGALAVGRARQKNIEGWAQRKRKSANEGGDRN